MSAAPTDIPQGTLDQGARAVNAEVVTWRLRREATAATWDALEERLRAQRTLFEALGAERVHVVATARRLASECAVLRDAARAERATQPAVLTRAAAGT